MLPDVVKDEKLGHLGEDLATKILKELEIAFEDLNSLQRLAAAGLRPQLRTSDVGVPQALFGAAAFGRGVSDNADTNLSSASRYFCLRISKKIFIEYGLSSTLVKPQR
jgi:hypothetical protein